MILDKMTAREFLARLVSARPKGVLVLTECEAKSALDEGQRTDLLAGGGRRMRFARIFGEREGQRAADALRSALAGQGASFDGIKLEISK